MANADRLKRYSALSTIDYIVRQSAGAYKHDEVFELTIDFTNNLLLLWFEQSSLQARENNIRRELNKPKGKK